MQLVSRYSGNMTDTFRVPLPGVLLWDLGHLSVASIETSGAVGETFAHADHVDFLGNSLLLLPGLVLEEEAGEDLLETLTEMLGDEGIDNGIEAGVGVRKAVGSQATGISGSVEGKMAKPEAQDDQVVRQPAEAEQDGHSHNHLGDLTLGLPRLGNPFYWVYRGPQELDGPGVCQAHHGHRQKVSKDKCEDVQNLSALVLPDRDADGHPVVMDNLVVTEVRPREEQ